MGYVSFFLNCTRFKFGRVSENELSKESHLISNIVDLLDSLDHSLDNRKFELVLFDGGDKTSIDTLDFFFNSKFDIIGLDGETLPEIV